MKCVFPQVQPESKKRKTLREYCSPYHNDVRTATAVSMMEQAPELGRKTLENALSADFTNFEVIDDAYKGWERLTASKSVCGFDHPEVKNAYQYIRTALGDQPRDHNRVYYGDDAAACKKKNKKAKHSRFGAFSTKCNRATTKLELCLTP